MKKFITSLILFILSINIIIGVNLFNIKETFSKENIIKIAIEESKDISIENILSDIFDESYDPRMVKYFDKKEIKETIISYFVDQVYYMIGIGDKPNNIKIETIFQLTLDEYAIKEKVTIMGTPLEKYYNEIEDEINIEEIPEIILLHKITKIVFGPKLLKIIMITIIATILLTILINYNNIKEGLLSISGTLNTTGIILLVIYFPMIMSYIYLLKYNIYTLFYISLELISIFSISIIIKIIIKEKLKTT